MLTMKPQDRAELIQVIRTTLLRRGSGQNVDDPVRRITQYWSTDGDLLAEVDDWRPQKAQIDALRSAPDVDEPASSPVSPNSPFGI